MQNFLDSSLTSWLRGLMVGAILCSVLPLALAGIASAQDAGANVDIDQRIVDRERNRIEVIAKATQATICIFGPDSQGGGSGVVISPDGYALSNYHVVESCGEFMKCSMNDGVLYDAVIVGIDPVGDVALIKMLGRDDFPTATMADSDSVQQGDMCFAVGNPFLLATNFQPSVSWGIVSGVQRYQYPSGTLLEYADCIQTDAAINPGNSGGALFNDRGELIGINGRGGFEKRGRVNVGVGFAISINQIKYFLDHLKSGRIIDHATLGATVAADDQGAVRVSNILESSDAWRRGLRYDDQIISFGGRAIQTVNQFKNILGIYPKGYRVPLVFQHEDEEERSVMVRLAGVHAAEQLVEMIEGVVEPSESGDPDVPNAPDDSESQPEEDSPDGEEPEEDADTSEPSLGPEEYLHLHIARRGFTNFYFNKLHRDRLWELQQRHWGDFSTQAPRWRLTGSDSDGNPVQIMLTDSKSGLQLGDEVFVFEESNLDLQESGNGQESLNGPEGLIATLHMWRRFLVNGPENFGDVIYFGSMPLEVNQPARQTLIATSDVIESHLFMERDSGRLDVLEMYPDIDVDAHRVQFLDYQQDNDLSVPGVIVYSHGDGEPVKITIDTFEFLKAKSLK